MLIACWSPKGGTGTTVVSCGLALVLSRSGPPGRLTPASHGGRGVLVADLSGDVPAVLGVPLAPAPGLADWLAAGPEVPAAALARLEVDAGPGLRLLTWGEAPPTAATAAGSSERGEVLAAALAADGRPVVVDCGSAASGAALAVAAAADLSLLVLRPCYLALRRALAAPIRPAGVVLIREPGRALSRSDVEDVLGVPVRAEIAYEEAIARAVDAGLLGTRIPRTLERALRAAA
jgi:Mrp family chromosome partitioning ATPase